MKKQKKQIQNETTIVLKKNDVTVNGRLVPPLLREDVSCLLTPVATSLNRLLSSPTFVHKFELLIQKPQIKTCLRYELSSFLSAVHHNLLSPRKAINQINRLEREWQHVHDQTCFEKKFRKLRMNESAEFETKNHKRITITRLNSNTAKVELAPNLTIIALAPIYQLAGLLYEDYGVFRSPFTLKEVSDGKKTLTEEEAAQAFGNYEKQQTAESIKTWFKHNLLTVRLKNLLPSQKLTRNNPAGTLFEISRTERTFEIHTDISIDITVEVPFSRGIISERAEQIASLLFTDRPIATARALLSGRYAQSKIKGVPCNVDGEKRMIIAACITNHYPPEIYPLLGKNDKQLHANSPFSNIP